MLLYHTSYVDLSMLQKFFSEFYISTYKTFLMVRICLIDIQFLYFMLSDNIYCFIVSVCLFLILDKSDLYILVWYIIFPWPYAV